MRVMLLEFSSKTHFRPPKLGSWRSARFSGARTKVGPKSLFAKSGDFGGGKDSFSDLNARVGRSEPAQREYVLKLENAAV